MIRIVTSTKKDGSMKYTDGSFHKNIEKFLTQHSIPRSSLVTMSQIHSANIKLVTKKDIKKRLNNTDGMITTDKNITLATVTADCLPVVFYDEVNYFLGIVHAGYKGILKGIIRKAIQKLAENGANKAKIKVHIGPSIGICCYSIPEGRLKAFEKKFGDLSYATRNEGENIYISLSEIAKRVAINEGVNKKNISVVNKCTKCSAEYFSFREDRQNTGLNITVTKL